MAALKIPERYKPGFLVLASLSESAFQEFQAAVREAPSSFSNRRELEAWVASKVKTIPPPEISSLINSITSFYRLQFRYGITVEGLAADLGAGARESISSFKVAEGEDYVGRLASLLTLQAFDVVSVKAKELQTQSERIFVEARVISDIRPVFGGTVENVPTAMMLVHTLKIVAHEGSTHKEYFMALDSGDIGSLIEILQRAQQKARTLQAFLDTSGLRSVDLSEKD